MIVLESDAPKYWCPFARVGYNTDSGGLNRLTFQHDETDARCIGPKCMAWQWVRHPKPYTTEPGSGYCGLAGKP